MAAFNTPLAGSPTGPSQDDLRRWIQADFKEMPDLRLTAEQAARFWSIGIVTARAELNAMADQGFLTRAGLVYFRAG
jgi:hypothetical protein